MIKHEYAITPVPKPRMTRSDRWKKRPCVERYWKFKDEVKSLGIDINPHGCKLTFIIPMPDGWNKKRKFVQDGSPHRKKPDIDNLIKGILDCLFDEDAHIWNIHAQKVWGYSGMIIVEDL